MTKRLRRPLAPWTLALQVVLTYAPLFLIGAEWRGMGGFAAGSVLAVLRGRAGALAFGAVLAADWAAQRLSGLSYEESAVALAVTLMIGLVAASLMRIACRLSWMRRAEASAIQRALQDERIRIGRDLHDLLAARLTFAALRGELVNRYLGVEDERARSELRGLLMLTRGVLADMRSMAHGFGDRTLHEEMDTARTVLGGMGLVVTVRDGARVPPGEVENLFAVAVGEAVTNVLRHSEADACAITLGQDRETVTLAVANNGVSAPPGSVEVAPGHGLGNLAARAAELGGTCTARVTPAGWFRFTVVCPVKERDRRRGAAIPLDAQCAPRRDDYAHRAL
ncbi:sensor histidine kinase [Streptomyces sp. NBC_00878]|uniref:sensor histidine kinase n=1 Tax=Streptomyces sp. NBC_00878 TaxID=2975854 RepID=UPI00225ACFFA|nr:histidine kinase [Streptomyces sp. NBC_00878]MCX4906879.1 histidine kinase [Streptomyces sp. NBC_00878]